MEEYLDIVDENGNLTGERCLRSIAHEKGLRHRTVHIYFHRTVPDGVEFVVHLRSKNKTGHPDCWDTRFGGHLESGQTFDEAAEKEVLEETGVEIEADDLSLGRMSAYGGGKNNEITQVYYYEFDDDLDRMSFPDGEVQEARWMTVSEIRKAIENEPEKWTSSRRRFDEIVDDLMKKLI